MIQRTIISFAILAGLAVAAYEFGMWLAAALGT
jgi:hypothetical protein